MEVTTIFRYCLIELYVHESYRKINFKSDNIFPGPKIRFIYYFLITLQAAVAITDDALFS